VVEPDSQSSLEVFWDQVNWRDDVENFSGEEATSGWVDTEIPNLKLWGKYFDLAGFLVDPNPLIEEIKAILA
jgi:hypothetical protein